MADESGARRLHPSETAGRGQRLGLTSRYKCKQCGFFVDSRKRSNKSIENETDGIVVTGSYDADTFSVDAKQGCPQCGSFNWSSKVFKPANQRPERPRFTPATYRRNHARF